MKYRTMTYIAALTFLASAAIAPALMAQDETARMIRISTNDSTEHSSAPLPSCSQDSNRQSGAEQAESEVVTFVGHCERNGTLGHLLTGRCAGHYLGYPICEALYLPQECPPGAMAIKPSFIGCPSENYWPVDADRPCSH